MIFVTVGTHSKSFDRLLKEVDSLIEKNKIKEKVIMQIGYSIYEPKNAQWFRFSNYKKMKELNKKARIVITHGGVGSILTALMYNKPVIAVPRLKKFNEHSDDHQLELVKRMSKEKKLIGVFNIKNLEKILSKKEKYTKLKSTKKELSDEIKKILIYLEKSEKRIEH